MFCPNCGFQNPESATNCSKCNFGLKGGAPPKFKGTMLMVNQSGSAPPGAPPAPSKPAGPPSKLKGTMVGVAPPVVGSAPSAPDQLAPDFGAPPAFGHAGVNPMAGTMAADGPTPGMPPQDAWGAPPAPAPAGDAWGAPPAPAPAGDAWGAPPAPAPAGDAWGAPPAPAPAGDAWGAPPAPAPAPPGGDAWGAPAAAGGYGAPPPAAAGGYGAPPAPGAPGGDAWGAAAGAAAAGAAAAGQAWGAPAQDPNAAWGANAGYGAPPQAGAMVPYGGQAMAPGGGAAMMGGNGPKGAVREPLTVLLLHFLPFYGLIYMFSMAGEVNGFLRREALKPFMLILLSMVTCGLYAMYWQIAVVGKVIQEVQQRAGVPNAQDHGFMYIIPVYNIYLMQDELNKAWRQPG